LKKEWVGGEKKTHVINKHLDMMASTVNEAKTDAATVNEATKDAATTRDASGVVVYDVQTEAHASFMARRIDGLLPTSMKYLDRFLGWDCAPTLLALKMFGSTSRAQEVSESVAMLQAIEQHVPHLSVNSEKVTCVVVGDGTKPRTAAIMAMNTRWQTFMSIDPAMENAPTNEFVAHGSIRRVWIAAAKIQDIAINITDDIEHVVVMLPHCHVVPDEALRSLTFQGLNATDKTTTGCPSSADLAATTAALSLADIRVVVVQMPCCRYVWHDTVAGAPPDVTYEYLLRRIMPPTHVRAHETCIVLHLHRFTHTPCLCCRYEDTSIACACRTMRIWHNAQFR
jgi:hypothetical protein